MVKLALIGIRLDAAEKEALEHAAQADDRTVSALARRIIVEWLRSKGVLTDVQDVDVPEVEEWARQLVAEGQRQRDQEWRAAILARGYPHGTVEGIERHLP